VLLVLTRQGRTAAEHPLNKLLADHGLITLKSGVGSGARLFGIEDKKGLEFKEIEAATLPRALNDVDAAVINGNCAIEADLEPATDSLALEKAEGNPYANFLAVKKGL
jgi:D-methionine transport system substrate-binding protein